MTTTWNIQSARGTSGAIGIVALNASSGEELDAMLERTGLGRLLPGEAKLKNLLGVDTGVAARWTLRECHLMPHGGIEVVRLLVQRLSESGVMAREMDAFAEARSPMEERMLRTLARAASPLAIDLLLDQPRRWNLGLESDAARDRVLNRLIDPPLVVAWGPPNVGKSTLVNALAGRSVSIVADEPGTTRDHVGVHLNLGGLAVRYFDTPGLRPTTDPIEAEAQAVARAVANSADLVLLLGDAGSEPPEAPGAGVMSLRIALRSDVGTAAWPHDCAVSVRLGRGVEELVAAVRERLVPEALLRDPRAWRFWNEHPAAPGEGTAGPV